MATVYVTPVTLPGQMLVDVAAALGVEHYHQDPRVMSGGVAIFDFDKDGYQDVYLTGGLGGDILYRNNGDDTFVDVTRDAGITFSNVVQTTGAIAADFDGDGFEDLFITTVEDAHARLLHNEAGSGFTDVSVAAGLAQTTAWSMSATAGDIDGDGDLDIYVGNYVRYTDLPFENHITGGLPNYLLRNDGSGRFAVELRSSPRELGCTLATLLSDKDRDGDPDLFVLNDFGDFYAPNGLFDNDPAAGTLTEESQGRRFYAAINAMGIAGADLNADQLPDYYITNIADNYLFESSPSGNYEERAATVNAADGDGASWGTAIVDLDDDGRPDIVTSKGSLLRGGNLDMAPHLLFGGIDNEWYFPLGFELAYVGNNNSRGLAVGDLNQDGHVDVVMSGVRSQVLETARTRVYINRGVAGVEPGHYMNLRLVHGAGGSPAVGALVDLYTSHRTRAYELSCGGSYLSSHAPVIHVGISPDETIDSVMVRWPPAPTGRPQASTLTDLHPDHQYLVTPTGEVLVERYERRSWCGQPLMLYGSSINGPGRYRFRLPGGARDTLVYLAIAAGATGFPECSSAAGEGAGVPHLTIYPVPFGDDLTVEIEGVAVLEAILFDLNGRRLNSRLDADGRSGWRVTLLEPATLPPGLYVLRLRTEVGVISRRVMR